MTDQRADLVRGCVAERHPFVEAFAPDGTFHDSELIEQPRYVCVDNLSLKVQVMTSSDIGPSTKRIYGNFVIRNNKKAGSVLM